MTEKQKMEKKVKRMKTTWRVLFLIILICSIASLIIGFYLDSASNFKEPLYTVGLLLIFTNFVFTIVMLLKIREHQLTIKKFCVKCDTPSLVQMNAKKEKIGEIKTRTATSPFGWSTHDKIRETKYYECKNCGHESEAVTVYQGEENK